MSLIAENKSSSPFPAPLVTRKFPARGSSPDNTCTVGDQSTDSSRPGSGGSLVPSPSIPKVSAAGGSLRQVKTNQPFRAQKLIGGSVPNALASARMKPAESNSEIATGVSPVKFPAEVRSSSSSTSVLGDDQTWPPADFVEKVVAIYDYTAAHVDELTFSTGDIIYILSKGSDGWDSGILESSRQQGLVPGNYVEPAATS